jgi:SSS family solute:Na+ symporter
VVRGTRHLRLGDLSQWHSDFRDSAVVITAIGFFGRHRPAKDLDEWAVAGRKFGVMTTWVLQAGETFTTFTFLGCVGLVVSTGAAAFYSIPYLAMYWITTQLWRRAKRGGHLTQSDFLRDSYGRRSASSPLSSALFSCCPTCSCRSPGWSCSFA